MLTKESRVGIQNEWNLTKVKEDGVGMNGWIVGGREREEEEEEGEEREKVVPFSSHEAKPDHVSLVAVGDDVQSKGKPRK